MRNWINGMLKNKKDRLTTTRVVKLTKMMATKLHNLSHSPSRLDGIIRETNGNGLKHLCI